MRRQRCTAIPGNRRAFVSYRAGPPMRLLMGMVLLIGMILGSGCAPKFSGPFKVYPSNTGVSTSDSASRLSLTTMPRAGNPSSRRHQR